MQLSALQLATLLNGKLEGNPDIMVTSLAKIEDARNGMLSFIANPKYEEFLYTTLASVVIINESLIVEKPISSTLIRVTDAYSSFAFLLEKYSQINHHKEGIQTPSYISPSAVIGKNVFIGAFTYIGDRAEIGDNVQIRGEVYLGDHVIVGIDTVLHAGVKIYNDCSIGNNVTIHAGAVIGSDGFGFAPQSDRSYKKVPQVGNVIIGDNVEIGANTTIDRATIGSTIIHNGVKLDNLIQIAHNVEIGENTVIAAQTGVSGSTKVGSNCIIGGQVGIVGHIHIADGTRINAQSGVSKSIKVYGMTITGSPAAEYISTLKSQAVFRNLPELDKRISELENQIKQIMAEKESI